MGISHTGSSSSKTRTQQGAAGILVGRGVMRAVYEVKQQAHEGCMGRCRSTLKRRQGGIAPHFRL